ncbi:hypothetical protein OSTOST_14038, partial [Ostertagia ostertagi]
MSPSSEKTAKSDEVKKTKNTSVMNIGCLGRYREPLENAINEVVKDACAHIDLVKFSHVREKRIEESCYAMLQERGVDSVEEFKEFLSTVERDEDLIENLCDMLETNVFQIKQKITELKDLKSGNHNNDEEMAEPNDEKGKKHHLGTDHLVRNEQSYSSSYQNWRQQQERMKICSLSEPRWNRHLADLEGQSPEEKVHGESSEPNNYFMAFLQAAACADPGIFRGREKDNFKEFVRRFRRKYCPVVKDEFTLIEILGDDHLGGRAKSLFLAMPSGIKQRGFQAVVDELSNMLAYESTAARIRALTDLRNLKIRPGQSIVDFCVVLESLGKKANPESTIEDLRNKKITIPIQNREHEPFVIKKGEKLGEWGTEKWLTKWEDCTMLDQESFKISIDEKQKLLQEQIQQNRKENSIEEDLTSLLISYADVFAVCEKELSQTDLVRMSIDTGDSQPVKLKTRPVPLGLRKRLKEMLQDLEDRKIIEKSNSDWAFPIVLVEKKDGSIRLCVDYRELN